MNESNMQELHFDRELYDSRIESIANTLERCCLKILKDETISILQKDSASASHLPLRIHEIIQEALVTEKEQHLEYLMDKIVARDMALQKANNQVVSLHEQNEMLELSRNRTLQQLDLEVSSRVELEKKNTSLEKSIAQFISKLNTCKVTSLPRTEVIQALSIVLEEGSIDSFWRNPGIDAYEDENTRLKRKIQEISLETQSHLIQLSHFKVTDHKLKSLVDKLQKKLIQYKQKCKEFQTIIEGSTSSSETNKLLKNIESLMEKQILNTSVQAISSGGFPPQSVIPSLSHSEDISNGISLEEHYHLLNQCRNEVESKSREEILAMYQTLKKEDADKSQQLVDKISLLNAELSTLRSNSSDVEKERQNLTELQNRLLDITADRDSWRFAYEQEITKSKNLFASCEKHREEIQILKDTIRSHNAEQTQVQMQNENFRHLENDLLILNSQRDEAILTLNRVLKDCATNHKSHSEFKAILVGFIHECEEMFANILGSLQGKLYSRSAIFESKIAHMHRQVTSYQGGISAYEKFYQVQENQTAAVNELVEENRRLKEAILGLQESHERQMNSASEELAEWQEQSEKLSKKLHDFGLEQQKFRKQLEEIFFELGNTESAQKMIEDDSFNLKDFNANAYFQKLLLVLRTTIQDFHVKNSSMVDASVFVEEELGHLREVNASLVSENESLVDVIQRLNTQKKQLSRQLSDFKSKYETSSTTHDVNSSWNQSSEGIPSIAYWAVLEKNELLETEIIRLQSLLEKCQTKITSNTIFKNNFVKEFEQKEKEISELHTALERSTHEMVPKLQSPSVT